MSGILAKVHKPKDCILLVAFPMTEERFINDLKPASSNDYAKSTANRYKLLPRALWQYHHLPLVKVITNVAATVQQQGVTVKLNTSLDDLQELSEFSVVTIVAHFKEASRQIELCDGLHSINTVTSQFDKKFCGVVDLSVCNSVYLQDGIKEKLGDNCLIRANRDPAEIKLHLIMYKQVIAILSQLEVNYLQEMIKFRMNLNQYIKLKL